MKQYELCHVDDIAESQSKAFELNDLSIFLVKKDGEIYAYKNSCPHLGIELEWLEDQFLDSESNLIQCSTHGALFVIDSGRCIAGPCLGEKLLALTLSIDSAKRISVIL
jgi:nitrite reductase/ring-hydroxylating ferredoxin subunit